MILFLGVVIILLMVAGLPLYLTIGSATLLLFNFDDWSNPSIFIETLRMIDAPTLLAIPLFTFTGFMLSKSKAPQRIVLLSQFFLGWLPGGLAIVSVLACALLTAFTGASGVTIIALGSLLYPSLIQKGYSKNFTTGLLTTSGSRGLLFPPSLPLILYAVVTKLDIHVLFKAAFIPGLLGVLIMMIYSFITGRQLNSSKDKIQFTKKKIFSSLYELPLPIIVLGGIYGGIFTVTEAACITVLYSLIVHVLILKEIKLIKELPDIMIKSMTLVGSILIILAMALSFTSYLVEEQIPMKILEFIKTHVQSKILFLVFLNIFLLIVGCMMDIFSAIIIVVPLINPIATELGINPYHLGIIFLTNLEIGYSTPPIGLNLFISSKTFKKSLFDVYKSTAPFLILLLIVLILITFVPKISLLFLCLS